MPDCIPDKDPCDILPKAGEAWSVCLPFGGRVWSDGNGVHANGGIAPPDGVYGKVVIADGCIVGVEPEDVPIYTGAPCASQPAACDDVSAVSVLGGGFTPEPTIITCAIEAGANIDVIGSGTEADPYVISADSGIFLRSDNSAISITGGGTRQNPYTVKHKAGLATSVDGMTFDAFGHLVSVSEGSSASKGVKGIVPGFGVAVSQDNESGIATVSLQPQPTNVPGDYQFGAFGVTLDASGRISAIQRDITIPNAPFVVACGATDLQINQLGAITAVGDVMNLGSGYLIRWPTEPGSANFTMRSSTALAGICFTELTDITGAVFTLDGQACSRIDKMFWSGGVLLAGQHSITVTGITGPLAVLLLAVA